METNIKQMNYTYNSIEIMEIVKETISNIEKWVDINNYRIINNLNNYKDVKVDYFESKNQKKKIQRYCYWINEKPTLKKVNSFLSLLSKIYKMERVQIKISLKEEKIKSSKKDWIKSKNESEKLLKIYKEEKGNFYK